MSCCVCGGYTAAHATRNIFELAEERLTYQILVVDDQRDVRRMLRAGIETLGKEFHITDVPSGEEALLLCSLQKFDLLVADVRLPGLSGLDLGKRALQNNPQLQLILITGVTDPAVRRQVEAAPAQAYFYKPIPMPEFLKVVEDGLRHAAGVAAALPLGQPGSGAVPAAEQPVSLNLSAQLAALRGALKALSVFAIEAEGKIGAMAGELPPPAQEKAFLAAVQSVLSAGAVISGSLGRAGAEALHIFRGSSYDLVLASVNPRLGLLVALDAEGRDQGEDLRLIQEAVAGLKGLISSSSEPGPTVEVTPAEPQPQAEAAALEPEGPLEPETASELDRIFDQATQKKFPPEEVDAFWDRMVENEDAPDRTNGEGLSYEEARRRGLAPENH